MRGPALLALLLWQSGAQVEPPTAQPAHMRYRRTITVPIGSGQACAALDAAVFPHAAPSLKDLRVFPAESPAARELPYVITLSETVAEETQPARVLNLGSTADGPHTLSFDLEMPDRPYTDVVLDLTGQDFLATASVAGMDTLGSPKKTNLGAFTLFDLSSQHLSRDTTLPLVESTFRYLHVTLEVSPAPGAAAQAAHLTPAMVEGAQVPPSREERTVYTTVASSNIPTTGALARPRITRFDLPLPLRVPVERVSFDLAPGYAGNFSRDVRVYARPEPQDAAAPAGEASASAQLETLSGTISRVHAVQAGHKIDETQLSVPATLGSNLQTPASVWVEIENGDDQPLPIAGVRLEMRQRKLCLDAPSALGASLLLYYGDPALPAPVYDYDRLFSPSARPLVAELGPEELNTIYVAPPAEVRPFTERHPEVLWIALIGVVCALGLVALKSSRNAGLR